jgi:hypothetical protein
LPGLTRTCRRRSGTAAAAMDGPGARAAGYPPGNPPCRNAAPRCAPARVRIARVQAHWLPVHDAGTVPTTMERRGRRVESDRGLSPLAGTSRSGR